MPMNIRPILCSAALLLASTAGAAPAIFTLSSTALQDGGTLPSAFVNNHNGCTGANHSPPLAWQHAPAGTRGFAVSVYDTDARGGKGWWHWVAAGIPATAHGLPENASADGTLDKMKARQGQNDSGQPGYGGACPPVGDAPHHYIVTVYALDDDGKQLDTSLPAAQLAREVEAHTLARATLSVTYGRSR